MPDSVRLPKGYLQVEWIKSSGTQYINTGISGQHYYRLDVQFDPTDGRQLYGTGPTGTEYCGCSASEAWEFISTPTGKFPTQRNIINYDVGTITSQKVSKWVEGSATLLEGTGTTWSVTISNSLLLYALSGQATFKWTAKVFRFTAYTTFINREKIADLIPCVRAYDNKPGLYDIVREQFLTNTGTGEFTYGPYVPYVEEPEDIPIQNNFVKKIGGKLFVWNQLVHNGNFVDTSYWSKNDAISFNVSGNQATIVRLDGSLHHVNLYQESTNTPQGHKYVALVDIYPVTNDITSTTGIMINNTLSSPLGTLTKGKWNKCAVICTPTTDSPRRILFYNARDGMAVGDTAYLKNFMVFDLTLMFGYGNEPATADEFIAMFPEPYYAYDQGTEKAKITGSIVARGKNQLDPDYILSTHTGSYLIDRIFYAKDMGYTLWEGSEDSLSVTLTCKRFNPMWKGSLTFWSWYDDGTRGTAIRYEADELSEWVTRSMVTPAVSGKKVTKVTTNYNYNFLFMLDIDKSQIIPGTNTSVMYPLLDPIETIIPNSITSLYGYGWGINGVENYVDFETQTYHQKIEAVNMGSLAWTKTNVTIDGASQIIFFANVPGRKLDYSKNIIFCKYASTNGSYSNLHNDKSICGYYYLESSRIAVRDSSFNDSTAADFKASINGIYLYYELAEEIVTPISGFVLPETYEGGSYELVDYFNPQDYTKNNLPITFEMSQGIIPLPSEKVIKIKPKSNEKFKMALPLHRLDYGLIIQVLNKVFPEGTFCSWETKSRTFLTYSYYGGCFDIPDAVLDANYEGDVIGHVCVPGLEGFRDSFDIFLPVRDMKLPEFGLVDYAINGDFTDSLDTTMYAANHCSIEKEVLCLKATCTEVTSDNNFNLHYYTAKAAGGIDNIKGHKFIGVCDIMANRIYDLTSRVNFYSGVQGGYGINYFTCIANKWVRHYTTVATVPDNATSWNFYEHYERGGTSPTQVGDWFRMKNLRVIDLTATYGYGNEPNSYEALIQDLNKRGISLTDDRVIKNFNQLVQNGDYTRPLDRSHYTTSRVDFSIEDKALKNEVKSTAYSFVQAHYIVSTVMSEVEKRINHKLITVYDLMTKLSNITSTANFYNGLRSFGTNTFYLSPNVWTRHYTQVVTQPADSTRLNAYESFIYTDGSIQLGDWFKIRNWMIFDLTEMYGTGSEPESYFQLVADLKSIGVDIENNYYELI